MNQTYGERFEAFSNRTILKIISKIGTYSYCTPLLICVGDCATVLAAWLPIFSLNNMRMRAMDVHLAHNQEVWFESSIRNSPTL